MKLIRVNRRIGNPGLYWTRIPRPGIRSGEILQKGDSGSAWHETSDPYPA